MRPRSLALPAALAVVLVATLRPLGGDPHGVTFCLACGERGGADALRNVLLFVPLGLAVGAWTRRGWTAVAACAALSVSIEIAQLALPGRDPSTSDLVFNTLGGAIGIVLARAPGSWLRPGARAAGRLSMAWAAVAWTAVAGTGYLLAPASPAGRAGVAAARDGDDVVLRFRSRAAAMGLDQPVVRLPGAPRGSPGEDARRMRAWRSGGGWCARAGARIHCGPGATAGRAWAMLAYPDALARRLGRWMDAAWLAALFLPFGLWIRREWIPMLACGTALAALGAVPAAGMLAATPAGEWAGAVAGIGIGIVAGRVAGGRAGSGSGTASDADHPDPANPWTERAEQAPRGSRIRERKARVPPWSHRRR